MPGVIDQPAAWSGNDLVGNAPDAFAQVISHDLALYANKIVGAAGIRLQQRRGISIKNAGIIDAGVFI